MRSYILYKLIVLSLIFSFGVFTMDQADAQTKNRFDLSGSLIPANEIVSGGPPRDGIPSIDDPVFIPAGEADYLQPEDRVLGIARQGTARAYPIRIMNWHEIVNDAFDGEPVAVHYDAQHRSARVTYGQGNEIPSVMLYWFAWTAFHPDTRVFEAG